MFDWYVAHEGEIDAWFRFALDNGLFQKLSAVMSVIFAVGLFALGAHSHAAQVRGEIGPRQFQRGYFTVLVAQLVPMMITGFVLHDPFIIGTRVGTLLVVLLVYGMVTSKDATFTSWRYRLWMTFWLSVAILGPMVWMESDAVRTFVSTYQKWIGWVAVIAMFAYTVHGQLGIAKELFKHFIDGNYTVKRLSLQVVRFFAYLFQAAHYWFFPTAAAPFLKLDPVFLQGFLGVCGTTVVIVSSIVGFLHGTGARRRKIRALQQPA